MKTFFKLSSCYCVVLWTNTLLSNTILQMTRLPFLSNTSVLFMRNSIQTSFIELKSSERWDTLQFEFSQKQLIKWCDNHLLFMDIINYLFRSKGRLFAEGNKTVEFFADLWRSVMRISCFWQLFLILILSCPKSFTLTFHSHLSDHRRHHNIIPFIGNLERPDPIEPPFHAPRRVSGSTTTRYGVRNGI